MADDSSDFGCANGLWTGEIAELEAAEARAAEAEDFDTAAAMSSQLDEVKARVARLQHDLNEIESSSKSAVRLVFPPLVFPFLGVLCLQNSQRRS